MPSTRNMNKKMMQQNKSLHKIQLLVTIVFTILSFALTASWYFYLWKQDQELRQQSED